LVVEKSLEKNIMTEKRSHAEHKTVMLSGTARSLAAFSMTVLFRSA
jgi:hypothetical protein